MPSNRPQGIDLSYYLGLVSRRRWFIIAPFCLAVLVGSYLAVTLPRIYEASTLILVQAQRVPEKLVQPVVSSDLDARISTISQQILSRSNLESVIQRFRLFSDPSQAKLFVEEKIEDLRKRIKVQVSRGRRDADAFTISYRDSDPKTTMQVTNALATFFINENLKDRETQAVGTSDFLEAELETMRKRLEVREQDLKEYRQQNMGELPEQLDSNLKILERLNQQLSQKEESLRSARVGLVALENELSARRNAMGAMMGSAELGAGGTGTKGSDEGMTLLQARERLAALLASYTEQHPDVVRMKARVEKLEAEAAAAGANAPQDSSDPAARNRAAAGRAMLGLSTEAVKQRTMLIGTIQTLETDIAAINKETREYQRRVEATPKREQELLSIKRDYENIKASYNSLSNRKLEAEISVNMEKKQKGEQFQIIDSARLPEKPVSPDVKRLFLITIVAGLGLGGGLVFLLDMLDSSVRRREDIEEDFGLPVLAAVPRIFSTRDKIRYRYRQVATAASVLVALVLTAGFAILTFNGVEKTVEIVKQYASRVG
jgi:polysaccharide chain length determinant protein (PEP-CTERM system associated)